MMARLVSAVGRPRPSTWAGTALLLALGAALRVAIARSLAALPAPEAGTYPYALYDHLASYVWNATLLPPLNYLVQALPIKLLGPAGNAAHHGHLYVNFTTGLLAAWLVYGAMRVAGVPAIAGWLLAAAMSAALIPFELWRANQEGAHYDHLTPVLASFLAYACARVARDGLTRRSVAVAASSGVLLILQLSTAAYFVPALFLLMVACEWFVGRLNPRPVRRAAALIVPALLTVLLLVAKNGAVAGVVAPGTRGGAALMMFVQSALDSDRAAVRKVAADSGVADWYLWCYDNAVIPPGVSPGGLWDRLAPAFGMCMPWGGPPNVAGKPWPFEYDGLIAQLQITGHDDLASWVVKDREDAVYRQYLLMGHSLELSPRWVGIYGQQSQRVGVHLLRTQPRRYFDTLRKHHRELFWGVGPEFPARTAGELHTLEYAYRGALARYARFGFSAVPRAAYLLLPWACLLGLAAVLVGSVRGRHIAGAGEALRLYLWLGLPVLMCALFYSGAVAVENDRYFMHVIPYLVVALGVMAGHVARMAGRRA